MKSHTTVEKEVLFKWLTNQAKAFNPRSQQYMLFSVEMLEDFYNHTLLGTNEDYSRLTMEGLNCISQIFLVMNERSHKIQIMTDERRHYGSHTNAQGQTISSSSNTGSDNPEKFFLYVFPSDLIGVDIFYRIIKTCSDVGVRAEAITMIYHLHSWLCNELEKDRTLIELSLVKKTIDLIDELKGRRQEYIDERAAL